MVDNDVGNREEIVEDELAVDALSMEEPAMVELNIGEVAMEVAQYGYSEQEWKEPHEQKKNRDN